VSERDEKPESYNRRTIQDILTGKFERQRADRKDQLDAERRAVREKRTKALKEVREKREKAVVAQRKAKVASVQPVIEGHVRQAQRALSAALRAAESIRINRYTEEGRAHRKSIKSLQAALGAVRDASRGGLLVESDIDLDTTEE